MTVDQLIVELTKVKDKCVFTPDEDNTSYHEINYVREKTIYVGYKQDIDRGAVVLS